MRVNFNMDNEKYKELKIYAIKSGFKSLTALFNIWIDKALEIQHKKNGG